MPKPALRYREAGFFNRFLAKVTVWSPPATVTKAGKLPSSDRFIMQPKVFFPKLGLVSAGASAVLAALHFAAPPVQAHWGFSIAAVLVSALVCVGLYYAGASSARSSNKYAFTNLVSVSVFGKMGLALAGLFIYRSVANPPNEWFVGIFLWCYIVFTIFEVWFMTKLAKMPSIPKDE